MDWRQGLVWDGDEVSCSGCLSIPRILIERKEACLVRCSCIYT